MGIAGGSPDQNPNHFKKVFPRSGAAWAPDKRERRVGGACSVGAAWAPDRREPSEQQRTLAPSPQARMREGSVYALVLSPSWAAQLSPN